MLRAIGLLAGLGIASASAVGSTPWQPQWTTRWRAEAPLHGQTVSNVRVADDGSIFVGLDRWTGGPHSVSLMRINTDGSFAWLRDREAAYEASIELVGRTRVALLAQGQVVILRLYDAITGNLIWERESASGQLFINRSLDRNQLAIAENGDFLIRASDGDDFVVIRFDANGNPLPEWRWPVPGSSGALVVASEIVALPDGGALVTGQGKTLTGGYATVRFDAQGQVVFSEIELGDLGNPLGPSRVIVDSNGDFILFASPESFFGAPKAQVWKLAADGSRQWLRHFPDPFDRSGMAVEGLISAGTDDVLVTAKGYDWFLQLIRIDGATGAIEAQTRSNSKGDLTTLVRAPNGRVLMESFDFIPGGGGRTFASLHEFDADGRLCRAIENHPSITAAFGEASVEGWAVLGASPYVQSVGSDVVAMRYDSDGACKFVDGIFADGFEPPKRGLVSSHP